MPSWDLLGSPLGRVRLRFDISRGSHGSHSQSSGMDVGRCWVVHVAHQGFPAVHIHKLTGRLRGGFCKTKEETGSMASASMTAPADNDCDCTDGPSGGTSSGAGAVTAGGATSNGEQPIGNI